MPTKKKATKEPAVEEFFYLGLGLASIAKDQLDVIASSLISEGKLLVKNRGKFQKDLASKGKTLYTKMQSDLEKQTQGILKKMDIPSRQEFEALKRQVAHKQMKK